MREFPNAEEWTTPTGEGETQELERASEQLVRMQEALEDYIEHPIEKDPRIKAYRQGLQQMMLAGNPLVLNTFFDHFRYSTKDEELPPIYTSNIALRAFQKILMKEENFPSGLRYPEDFDTPEAWIVGITSVLENKKHYDTFRFCIDCLNIQSNIADRYKSLKLLMHLYGDRFKHSPRIIDVGCSQNLGLNIIAKNLDFFSPTALLPDDAQEEQTYHDLEHSIKINELLKTRVRMGTSVGVDLFSINDPTIISWIRSCSFYPSELLDKKRVSHYNKLANSTSYKVKYVWNDFLEPSSAQTNSFNTELPGPGSMDVAVLSTVLYQHSPEERSTMILRAFKIVKNNGLIMVQDFASVDAKDPWSVDFSSWSHNGSDRTKTGGLPYKTLILDKTQPERGFMTFLEWSNGRCEKLRLGPLALEKMTVSV